MQTNQPKEWRKELIDEFFTGNDFFPEFEDSLTDFISKVEAIAYQAGLLAGSKGEREAIVSMVESADKKAISMDNWQVQRRDGFREAQNIIRDCILQSELLTKVNGESSHKSPCNNGACRICRGDNAGSAAGHGGTGGGGGQGITN